MSGAGPTKVASAPKTVASEPASKMSSVKMEASATAAPAGNAAEPAANGGASAPTAADFSQWAAAAAMQQYYAGAKQATGAAQTGQQAAAYYAQMASNPGLYPQMWAGQAVRVPPPRPFESRVFFFLRHVVTDLEQQLKIQAQRPKKLFLLGRERRRWSRWRNACDVTVSCLLSDP